MTSGAVVDADASLAGRVVIVTGGGAGLGRAYCEALGAAGAHVAVTDIDPAAAEETAALVAATGGRAVSVPADVSSPDDVRQLVASVTGRFGRLDGVVNNAAIMTELPRGGFEDIPLDQWDRVMAVNLRGPFLVCREAVPVMRAQRYGKIVNVSSARAFEGTPGRLHYTTSKAGILGLTRALAREVGGDGITVNAIAPGLTLSPRQQESSDPAYLERAIAGRALPRPGVAADLLGAVLFFLGSGSDFVTGQCLVVDGGKVMI